MKKDSLELLEVSTILLLRVIALGLLSRTTKERNMLQLKLKRKISETQRNLLKLLQRNS